MYRLCYSFRVHISWSAPRAAERAAKHRSNSAKTRTCRVCFSNKPASGCSALQASSSSPSDGRPLPDARDAAAAAAATPPRCTARCGREQISRRQALVLLRTCAVCHSRVSTRSVWWRRCAACGNTRRRSPLFPIETGRARGLPERIDTPNAGPDAVPNFHYVPASHLLTHFTDFLTFIRLLAPDNQTRAGVRSGQ